MLLQQQVARVTYGAVVKAVADYITANCRRMGSFVWEEEQFLLRPNILALNGEQGPAAHKAKAAGHLKHRSKVMLSYP